MRLTTRSRYGTRLMIDMAQHYDQGAIQLGDIARRQGISIKYFQQIIIPLRRANYVKSVRGSKGGYMLAEPPERITIGEIVALLEGGASLTECSDNPLVCKKADLCLTRGLWKRAAEAIYNELGSITLRDLLEMGKTERGTLVGQGEG